MPLHHSWNFRKSRHHKHHPGSHQTQGNPTAETAKQVLYLVTLSLPHYSKSHCHLMPNKASAATLEQSSNYKHNKNSFHGPYPPITYNPGVTRVSPQMVLPTCYPLSSPLDSTQCISLLQFLQLQASSVYKPNALKSFSITSLHVLFGCPLGRCPSTSISRLLFTQ